MKISRFALISLGLIWVAAIVGCGGGGGGVSTLSPDPTNYVTTKAEAANPGTWTVLVYLDADNDLESAGIRNFNQMEAAGSTTDVRVIVQMDRHSNYDASNGDWSDTRRYLITHDTNPSVMHSVRLDDPPLGELDMGDWHTLKDFVEWGVQEFPADHYCLVIWDHGTGWEIRSLDNMPTHKYIAVDDTDGGKLNVTEMAQALQNVNIDVLAFDACLMQQMETAYELKDSTRYLVASAAPEPTPGYNYQAWLRRMSASTSPLSLARIIVEEYASAYPAGNDGITQSAVDMSKMDALADAVDGYAQVMMSKAAIYPDALKQARTSSLNYSVMAGGSQRYSVDLLDYAQRSSGAVLTAADGAFATLQSALADAVVEEIHNPDTPNAHGLGIYLPPPSSIDGSYRLLKLAADTHWDEWISGQVR